MTDLAGHTPAGRTTATGGRLARALAVATAAVAAALSLAQPAAAKLEPPPVPSKISVGAGSKPYLVGHALGVQIYSCNAAAGGFAWGLVAPRANLYDDHGHLIVTHYGGPTWEARDGSRVLGRRIDGVTVDATAIPWLLLSATPSGKPGRLANTTFIQRIATTGGLAPAAADCDADTVGTIQEIPYTADYLFWKATGA